MAHMAHMALYALIWLAHLGTDADPPSARACWPAAAEAPSAAWPAAWDAETDRTPPHRHGCATRADWPAAG